MSGFSEQLLLGETAQHVCAKRTDFTVLAQTPLLHALVGAYISVYVLQYYFWVRVWVEMMSRAPKCLQRMQCESKVYRAGSFLNEVCVYEYLIKRQTGRHGAK